MIEIRWVRKIELLDNFILKCKLLPRFSVYKQIACKIFNQH